MEAIASLVTSAVLLLWQTCLNRPLTSYTMATISSYFGPGSGRRPDPERVILDLTYLNPRPNDHDGILIEPDEFERNGSNIFATLSGNRVWLTYNLSRTRLSGSHTAIYANYNSAEGIVYIGEASC
ncbi:hypothetical protein MRS44_018189 [Fusarium solani]|uniref:uncharacterized protein n=1 Tax=Fusarium solani TaxID=169388 RepID=UPI0032C47781|nr:hypothetical protein MRS44_018189 [Fusarium solani]